MMQTSRALPSRRSFCGALAAVLAGASFEASAAPTVSLFVNAAVTVDAAARLMAEQFHADLNRDFVVMPKLGAGGRIAVSELRRAAPDGNTLLLTPTSVLTLYPNIYKRLDYNPDTDLTIISGVSTFDIAIAVDPHSNLKTLQDVLSWAKGRPEGLTTGSAPGNGSSNHFLAIALAAYAKVPLTLVPYKATPQAVPDLASGRLPVLIGGTGALTPMHTAGQIRIIATSGPQRSVLLPSVPNLKDSGVDLAFEMPTVLLGPARMPPEVVAMYRKAVLNFLDSKATKDRLASMGMLPFSLDAPAMTRWISQERQRYASLVKASGYVPEEE